MLEMMSIDFGNVAYVAGNVAGGAGKGSIFAEDW